MWAAGDFRPQPMTGPPVVGYYICIGEISMAAFYNQATLSYNNITLKSNIVTGEITETLSVTKTAVSDAYSPGEVLTYAVSLVNSGTSDLT